MGTLFFELALTLYFSGFLLGLAELLRKKSEFEKVVYILSLIGFLLHTVYLCYRYIKSGQAPVFSMHEATAYFSWCILGVALVIDSFYKIKILKFSIILDFLITFISAFFSRGVPHIKPEFKNILIGFHALLAVLGVAIFSVAFILSILYIFQEKSIKSKKFKVFDRVVPSLEILDKASYLLIFWGFIIYSIGVTIGVIEYLNLIGLSFDPKEIGSLFIWFVYLSIFYLRVKGDWRKKKAAYLTIFGFFLVIFSFFGINLFFESFHRRL
ncbi:MAG: cytochrome c biogenesis protein CcsA [Thermodesulfovibrionaceae bacterium]